MDYFFKTEELEEIIETNQNKAKNNLAKMYAECRKSKRITQEELAKRAGISRTNITRFEGGDYNPSVEMLVKIANAMDMNVNIELEEIADGERSGIIPGWRSGIGSSDFARSRDRVVKFQSNVGPF